MRLHAASPRRAIWARCSRLPTSRRRPARSTAREALRTAACGCASSGEIGSVLGAAGSEAAVTRLAACFGHASSACGANRSLVRASRDGRASFWRPPRCCVLCRAVVSLLACLARVHVACAQCELSAVLCALGCGGRESAPLKRPLCAGVCGGSSASAGAANCAPASPVAGAANCAPASPVESVAVRAFIVWELSRRGWN